MVGDGNQVSSFLFLYGGGLSALFKYYSSPHIECLGIIGPYPYALDCLSINPEIPSPSFKYSFSSSYHTTNSHSLDQQLTRTQRSRDEMVAQIYQESNFISMHYTRLKVLYLYIRTTTTTPALALSQDLGS